MPSTVRTAILALGNPDRGDDGFSSLLLQLLDDNYQLPSGVELFQAENRPLATLTQPEDYDWLIILDTCLTKVVDPDLQLIDPYPVQTHSPGEQPLSSHQLDARSWLALLQLQHKLPPRVSILAARGKTFQLGASPSPLMRQQLEPACDMLLALLRQAGLHPVSREATDA